MDDGELSDEQIYLLLHDAAERLSTSLEQDGRRSNTLARGGPHIQLPDSPSRSYIRSGPQGATIDPQVSVANAETQLANQRHGMNDPLEIKRKKSKDEADAGSNWFNLSRTKLTPELKRDFQILKMRSVLDRQRHYKKQNDHKQGIPEFSQVGTIIEGPTEYFTARLTRKERKQTFAEEVLEAEQRTQRFKSKYNEIQIAKSSGKKAYCKALKARRTSKRSNR